MPLTAGAQAPNPKVRIARINKTIRDIIFLLVAKGSSSTQ
jgi:hypothetical protein